MTKSESSGTKSGRTVNFPKSNDSLPSRAIVKFEGTPIDDQGFTPSLPGVTDVDIRSPSGKNRSRWTKTASPIAIMTTGLCFERLRRDFSRSKRRKNCGRVDTGTLTSIRFAPPEGTSVSQLGGITADDHSRRESTPRSAGSRSPPCKISRTAGSAQGTTDFSGLFIGFSFFLILSAMILIGLLFRLGIERRVASIGLVECGWFARETSSPTDGKRGI